LIGDRDGAADAAIAPGDDGFLSRKTPGAFVTLLAMIRAKLHRARRTGHRLLLRRIRRLWIIGHGQLPGHSLR
jgi:hypothetical protein